MRGRHRKGGGKCCWCLKAFPRTYLSREHLLPKAFGGKDVNTNVAVACKGCNCRRGELTCYQAEYVRLASRAWEYDTLSPDAQDEVRCLIANMNHRLPTYEKLRRFWLELEMDRFGTHYSDCVEFVPIWVRRSNGRLD